MAGFWALPHYRPAIPTVADGPICHSEGSEESATPASVDHRRRGRGFFAALRMTNATVRLSEWRRPPPGLVGWQRLRQFGRQALSLVMLAQGVADAGRQVGQAHVIPTGEDTLGEAPAPGDALV